MRADYSLTTVVKDGPITAPRWVHHFVVKVGLGALIISPLVWLGLPLAFAALIAVALTLTAKAIQGYRYSVDWVCDSSLTLGPVPFVLAWQGHHLIALLALGLLAITYARTYPWARP